MSAPVTPAPPADEYRQAITQAATAQDEHLQASANQLLELRLANSGLPAAMQDEVREQFQDTAFRPPALDRAIARRKTVLAELAEGGVITGHNTPLGSPRIEGMFNSYDRIQAAYEALMGLEVEQPALRKLPPLTGIKELYIGLTGDRAMRGVYTPENIQFAVTVATSPNTATIMAELTKNVQNKLLLKQWGVLAAAGYNWWKRVVAIEHFNSLQPTSWIVSGGFGDLPTIADGAVYPELALDDKREPISFLKKGGYTSLTLEMIDKDDVQGWKSVGKSLATAALRTISAAVASVFTTNATLNEDSVALFSVATHGNLLSMGLDYVAWDQAVQAVYKMSEFNSSKRLALRPDRVLVPIELRSAALKLFYSVNEPGGSKNDINTAPLDGTKDSEGPVIVVPDWTDPDNWAAICNPVIAPLIGCGFRFGETPELFTAADPSSYLLFFGDSLPIKVRWFYAVGAVDFRSGVMSIV